MSDAADKARFAAREFIAWLDREMGAPHPPLITDRMLFAYEMGYLRGCSETMRSTMQMIDDGLKIASKEGDDDADGK